jgi:hypothetical protein
MWLTILSFVTTLVGIAALAVAAFAGLGAVPIMFAASLLLLGLASIAFALESVTGAIVIGGVAILLGTTGAGLGIGQVVSNKLK